MEERSSPLPEDWVGRERSVIDTLDDRPLALMQSVIPAPVIVGAASRFPPLRHWLYFMDPVGLDRLGPDGHPERGDFLPPVPLPRRMWAGGQLEFHRPLVPGARLERHSRIADVTAKRGSSSALCFVTVEHVISIGKLPCLTERQDLVFRGPPPPGGEASRVAAPPGDPVASESITPTPILLFRYSAATWNAHRIHFDRDYCRDIEGYPGLVVHGPLIATLLADLAVRHAGAPLKRFAFRAVAPLFDTAPFTIHLKPDEEGTGLTLWAQTPTGGLAMSAEVETA